jgi:uncharacterized protein
MIIDGHQHLVDDYRPILARMDALGITRTVLVGVGVRDLRVVTIRNSLVFKSHFLFKTFGMMKTRALVNSRALKGGLLSEPRNDAVLRAIRERPDRFDGFVFVNPESPRALDEVQRGLAAGMKGIKLALVQYPTDLNGPKMAALFGLAQAKRIPIFLHQGITRESSDISGVVKKFRDVIFIIAHTGCQCYDAVLELAKTCDNVFVDTSSYIATRKKIQRLCDTVGGRKLIFGTDVPVMCADPLDALQKIETLKIADADKEKALGENLREILRRAGAMP